MMNIARIFAAAAFCNVALFSLVGAASPEPTPKTKQSFPWSQPSGTSGKPQQQAEPQRRIEPQQQTQRSKQGVDFTLEGCQKSSKGLLCSLSVTNTSEFDRDVYIPSGNFISIIDSEGNSYRGAELRIANSHERVLLPPNVKAPLKLLFQPNGPLTDQIKLLEINLYGQGSSVMQFRDITVGSRSAFQSTQSQPTQSQSCPDAVEATRHRLASIKKIKKVEFSQHDISETYPDHPNNRSQRYWFAMKGDISSLMNSPTLMTDLTQNIISNCSDVGMVSFSPIQSDWIADVGLLTNGRVGLFKCIPGFDRRRPNRRPQQPTWGQQACN
jgi:hypothetical protein